MDTQIEKRIFFWIDSAESFANTEAPVIGVEYEVEGYFPVWTPHNAEDLNIEFGWTEAEIRSAQEASMFGWHAPCAKPAIDAVLKWKGKQ